MKNFNNNMLNITLEPYLKLEKKKFIQVTHDECYFYANDK